jgi:Zn-dependent protease
MICSGCDKESSDQVLSCPHCLRLTHAAELEHLAERARAAWKAGDFAQESALWTQSLALLPENTVQYRSLQTRIAEIHQQVTASPASTNSGWRKASMGIVPLALLLLTKGQFLLLGLTKIGTLVTMLASLGVYWSLYGWSFALGLVFSIYIHEMGHVAAIRRYGFPASAPMFIPGLGAFIQLRGIRVPPVPDSRIGLAGPIYGFGAALAALGIYLVTNLKVWGVIAHFGAVINLFNLIPVWQLDGSRGLHSFTRSQRGVVLVSALILWMITTTPMLLLVAMGCTYRMFTKDWQQEPDRQGMLQFIGLLIALSIITLLSPL